MLATKPLEYDTDGRVRKWTRIVVKWFIRNNLLHEHFHTDIFSSQCPHHEHITCEAGSQSYFRRHKGNCVNFNLFLPRALQKDVLDLDIIIGEVVKEQFDGNEEDPKRMECIFGVVKKLVTSQIDYWDESRFEYPARASSYFSGDKKIDLMITLGGDGTILHAAWLFQTDVPPILPFYLGSLGFLTIFNPSDYSEIFEQHLLNDTPTNVTLRMRLSCRVVRQSSTLSLPDSSFSSLPPQQTCEPSQVDKSTQISFSSNSTGSTSSVEYEEINSYPSFSGGSTSHDKSNHLTSNPPFSDPIHILNEVVIERGASPHMVNLEVFVNGKYWTKISADGVVVATPTGSTAYSLSAGGSLVHPVQNAILITPICPHLLTGRPMILPSNLEIQIRFPCGRGQAWASFDSRHRTPLNGGDTLIITVSKYPVPTLCVNDSNEDWLSSLEKCLLWNERRDVAAVTAGNGNGVNGEQVKSVL
ncbi:ATP-NAD kinase-like domain-containing protein [Paraphysoderma sedebokerense]|nr:ATP-NAD kinase-like domain-containing protein [Paraphysoderma sedebokerense]